MSFFGILFISLRSVVRTLCACIASWSVVSVQLGWANWELIRW